MTMTVRLLTLTMLMKRTPCSEEYLPVEEEDEYKGEEEGGAGGKDLVGQLLAHLNDIDDDDGGGGDRDGDDYDKDEVVTVCC